MMFRAATLVEDPTPASRRDGRQIYTAIAEIEGGEDPKPRMVAILTAPVPGMAGSYRAGDRLWGLVVGVDFVALAAAGDVGADGTNNMLLARAGAESRIGEQGHSGAWQSLMLFDEGSDGIDTLKSAMLTVLEYLGGLLTAAGDTAGATQVGNHTAGVTAIVPGRAAHAAKAQP